VCVRVCVNVNCYLLVRFWLFKYKLVHISVPSSFSFYTDRLPCAELGWRGNPGNVFFGLQGAIACGDLLEHKVQ